MLLAIDVGNTQTVIGVFDGPRLASHWLLSTASDRTHDEYRVWLRGILELEGLRPADLTGVATIQRRSVGNCSPARHRP